MTRLDLLWAGIRLLGVWTSILALQAAFKLPGALFIYLNYLQVFSSVGEYVDEPGEISSQIFAVAGNSLIASSASGFRSRRPSRTGSAYPKAG